MSGPGQRKICKCLTPATDKAGLRSKRFRASSSRKLGREQKRGMKGEGKWKRLLRRLDKAGKCPAVARGGPECSWK